MTKTKRMFMTMVIAGGLAIPLSQTTYAQQSGRKTLAPLISGGQRACSTSSVSTSGSAPLETVSINNGTVSRNVIVQFSAETSVDPGQTMNLEYKIDGGSPIAIGPYFFSTDVGGYGTRTAIGL